MKKVLFFADGVRCVWSRRGQLRIWLQEVAAAEGYQVCSLRLVLCSSERQQVLHKRYLGQVGDTDVITFDLRDEGQQIIDGELYLSLPQLQLQAARVGVPFFWELAYVVVHGVLHLCGYDDGAPVARVRMRATEERCMVLLQQQLKESEKLWHVSRET